jgi:hypothetical protein
MAMSEACHEDVNYEHIPGFRPMQNAVPAVGSGRETNISGQAEKNAGMDRTGTDMSKG